LIADYYYTSGYGSEQQLYVIIRRARVRLTFKEKENKSVRINKNQKLFLEIFQTKSHSPFFT
jgi:hypothetical protein